MLWYVVVCWILGVVYIDAIATKIFIWQEDVEGEDIHIS